MMKMAEEITLEQWDALAPGSCLLLDVRDETAFSHGALPGAVRLGMEELRAGNFSLPGDRPVIVYCMWGILSAEAAEILADAGCDARSLAGGYAGWLRREMARQQADETRCAEIELGLRKRWKRELFTPFARAICRYDLLKEGDRVAVCISGGKDSMLMAKLFQELRRHNKYPFELVFLVMDPGYNEVNRAVLEANARLLNVPVTVFQTDIFDSVYHVEKSPCYLCARMRRGWLYKKAQELGCNKIALGHHYDDVIETTLMSMLCSGEVRTMVPKLRSTNYPGMELIRPLYLVREDAIRRWRDANGLHFLQCACHFTDTCTTCHTDGTTSSMRLAAKKLIAELKKTNPQVESNIFSSMENVNLDTVLGCQRHGVRHDFAELYGE
jgi:tRNA 2-thiocytidine biosynthesis protein TtcA